MLSLLQMAVTCAGLTESQGSDWPQFRGANAAGRATGNQPLPADIAPNKHLLWKSPLAKGHSSPVISGKQIFVTAKRDKKLLTIALDVSTGKSIWEREAPYDRLESIHRIGSHATPSVATDGKHVVSMFGSCGLFCYDIDGTELWRRKMGPFDNQFGASSSPVLVGNRVVLVQDHDNGSFLTAIDIETGDDVWRTNRNEFRRNYGTPTIWTVGEQTQIVIPGTAQVTAYDLSNGKLIWNVHGVSRVVNTTPVVGEDGRLYIAAAGGGSTREPEFKAVLATVDANGNSQLEQKELPGSPIKSFFGQFDRNKDGSLTESEYESIHKVFGSAHDAVLCIRPGGVGDVTASHVVWEYAKTVPRNSSPLWIGHRLYLVKDGGILTCLDTTTGRITKQGRLSIRGKFYSSPVSGDGKIYVISERGQLCVLTADADWRELATADFEEDVYATPAIVDGRIYIRTVGHLYCFGLK
jgi:outer membrane protein assembly factor BamB